MRTMGCGRFRRVLLFGLSTFVLPHVYRNTVMSHFYSMLEIALRDTL